MFTRKKVLTNHWRRFRHYLRTGLMMLLLFSGCSDVIEYSPYDTFVNQRNINQQNINKLASLKYDTLVFAFLSDSHIFYDELYAAVKHINTDTSIRFVVVGGDITSLGLVQEYEWYLDIIEHLRVPFITVIGNHDYFSNGQKVYSKMFGPSNFYFSIKSYKFIIFDDVVWENDNRSPDFRSLLLQLSDTTFNNIIVTHIPPWSDQLELTYQPIFVDLLKKHPPLFALFGHTHVYQQGSYAGIPYAISGTIEDRTFLKIMIAGQKVNIKKIDY